MTVRVLSMMLISMLPAVFACREEMAVAAYPSEASSSGAVTIDPRPTRTLSGSNEGRTLIENGVDATVLDGGRMAVADYGASGIQLFDGSGRHIRQIGRRGRGPGEFRSVDLVHNCAHEGIVVWDRLQGELSVLDSAGAVASRTRLPGGPMEVHCAGLGRVVILTTPLAIGRPSAESPVFHGGILLATTSGDSIGSLGIVSLGPNRPLTGTTTLAVTATHVFAGIADSGIVRVLAMNGDTVGQFNVGDRTRPATPAHYEAAIDRLVAPMTVAAERDDMKSRLLEIERPAQLPAFRALRTDPAGRLWAVTSPLGEGVTELQVYDASGKHLGEVRLPFEADVYEVGTDYILGAYEAADGYHVVVYRYEARS